MANTTGKKWGGREKGTPNEDNKISRKLVQSILSDRVDDYNDCLDKLKAESPKDFVTAYNAMLPYAIPKLASVELTGDDKKPLSIVTEFKIPKNDRE